MSRKDTRQQAQKTLDDAHAEAAKIAARLAEVEAQLSDKLRSFGDDMVSGLDPAGLRANIARLEDERDLLRQKGGDVRLLIDSLQTALDRDRKEKALFGMVNAYERFDIASRKIIADDVLDAAERRIDELEKIFSELTNHWNRAHPLEAGEQAVWSYKRAVVKSRIQNARRQIDLIKKTLDPQPWILQ